MLLEKGVMDMAILSFQECVGCNDLETCSEILRKCKLQRNINSSCCGCIVEESCAQRHSCSYFQQQTEAILLKTQPDFEVLLSKI